MSGRIRVAACTVAGALLLGCDGGTGPDPGPRDVAGPPARRIEIVSGDHQQAVSGTRLAYDLVVRLLDQNVHGVPEAPLAWRVASGAGRLTSDETFYGTWTDAEGYARATFMPEMPGVSTVSVDLVGSAGVRTVFTFDAAAPDWPAVPFASSRIFYRVGEDVPGIHTRYVLEDGESRGGFSLQFLSCCAAFEYAGVFSTEGADTRLEFYESWDGWIPADPADRVAAARIDGDSLFVTYFAEMRRWGFVSGLYVLAR